MWLKNYVEEILI